MRSLVPARFYAVMLIFIFLLPLHAQQKDQRLRLIDDFISENLDYWNIPGLAIGIVENDSIIFLKGYGITRDGSDENIDGNTLFGIASNSKLFTASALAKIINEGEAEWNNKVIDILDDFRLYDPYATLELTLLDLLIHRSGLSSNQGDFIAWGSSFSRQEIIHKLRYIEPAYSFRYTYGYSNLMYLTAGETIRELSALSWEEYLQQHIFDPAGMSRTNTSIDSLPSFGNYASPHTTVNDSLIILEPINLDNIAPCGSINSSAHDMCRWLRLQLSYGRLDGEQILDSAIIAETRIPHTPVTVTPYTRDLYPHTHMKTFGKGIIIADYFGYELFYHPGNIDGMLSLSGFIPEKNIGLVVLTNCDRQPFYNAVFYYALDRLLNAPIKDYHADYVEMRKKDDEKSEKPKEKKEKFDHLPLDRYSGEYLNPMLGLAIIELNEKDRLAINLPYHSKLQSVLEHNNANAFTADWNDPEISPSKITFCLDEEGRAESFSIKLDFDSYMYTFHRSDDK